MEWPQLITDIYERIAQILEKALDGLTQEDLNQQPHPDSNSIGWLTWHLTRVQDNRIAGFMGKEQLWIKDGWHTRFNRPPDPADIGMGHSSEDVAAFKSPNVNVLLEYHRTVLEQTKQYFVTLSMTDLDRPSDVPKGQPPMTVGARLVGILSDGLQHAGQVAYLRGLFKGKGWLGV